MSKKQQSAMIEPTEGELSLYQNLIQDISEHDMDFYANQYFELVQAEKINISFPKFIIDKIIRPIEVGDTITIKDSAGNNSFLICLIRKEIEGKDYLIFGKVDNETETVIPEDVYLFHVEGRDEAGIEIIDIVESSPEAERILDIIEGDEDVELIETNIQKEE